jgi:hypothetical protein
MPSRRTTRPRRTTRRPPANVAALVTTRSRKVKTSVSLSEGLLHAVDALAGKASRSAWIERSVRASVLRALRRQRDENEVRLLNQHADSLNQETPTRSPIKLAGTLSESR